MTESQKAASHTANLSKLSNVEDLIDSLIVVDDSDEEFINHVLLCIRDHYSQSRRKLLEAEIKHREAQLAQMK